MVTYVYPHIYTLYIYSHVDIHIYIDVDVDVTIIVTDLGMMYIYVYLYVYAYVYVYVYVYVYIYVYEYVHCTLYTAHRHIDNHRYECKHSSITDCDFLATLEPSFCLIEHIPIFSMPWGFTMKRLEGSIYIDSRVWSPVAA